ncbi:hypothetical protein [Neisseria weixii]|uniref:hypothetical protein n=1 Tax=Neisseria weixii TaxID=1853276 RepID=UPI0035A03411
MVSEISQYTDRIKAGAVGVMLPNHAPLLACEQYGTGHSMPQSRRNWLGADKGYGFFHRTGFTQADEQP